MKAAATTPVPLAGEEPESRDGGSASALSAPPVRTHHEESPAPEKPPGARELARLGACNRLAQLCTEGLSLNQAIAALRDRDPSLPSAGTLYRWYRAWQKGGGRALTDGRGGRQRKEYGWEARAIELWLPTRPSRSTVAYWLRGEGHDSATPSRVRRYLNQLPTTVGGEHAKKRAGIHYYRLNVAPYVVRDSSCLDVGMIYEGDGHRAQVFVEHPRSGGHYRPELTIWIDVRSHYLAGWWLAEDESAVNTLYSLSRALIEQDHVPGAIHVDPGPGFKNRLLLEASTGWLSRVGVEVMYTRPANPKGKGLVEGWFRWFEERVGRRFSSFSGLCRTDNDIRRLEKSVRDGRVRLPTLAQYADAVRNYVAAYNTTYQENLGCAPADLWARLERSPVELPAAVLLRPAETCTVRRGGITLFKRLYRAPELVLLEGRKIQVEYDLTDAARVWIRLKRQIVEAQLVNARPWLPASRIEDLQQKRKTQREKRIERKWLEVQAQERPSLDVEARELDAFLPSAEPEAPAAEIDPYDCIEED